MKKLLTAVLLTWGVFAWAEDASIVRIAQSDGSVEIRRGGAKDWKPAKEGDVLERGDRIAARDKSAVLLSWSNGSMAKLYPNTEIELAGVSFDLEKKLEQTILELVKGRVFAKAQVPEHLFADFQIRMGGLGTRAQGAEFALNFDPEKKTTTAWSILGRVVADTGTEILRIDEGSQATIQAGVKPGGTVVMDDKIKQSLAKVSKDLGGSLLIDDVGAAGGEFAVKIGGVVSRRGNAPYKVGMKALAKGGSGKLKSVSWEFGDGESAKTKDVEHTFTQGLYVVILRAEDENGEKATAQTAISVEADCGC
ncbi:PKD domain-containing protein [Sulfuritalea sp.]|uniref:PKD domain-containing protein n=1 Tax=Sulfuritalea sp. TaxID=2480090 RepID=UPI00286DDCBA|nr:PKD domain-containing protein [Sulfuritalea sp.]